jgi:DUF1009 family protein
VSADNLGILAGGGVLPLAVAEAAIAAGRQVHIVAIRGEADPAIERYSHSWVRWGEIGHLLDSLKRASCRELVIIGSVSRPDLTAVRLDLGAIRNLPRLVGLLTGGDDSVLSSVVRFFEGKGLVVRGAHEVAPQLVASHGPLGSYRPSSEDQADIAKGLSVVRALGDLDVGQAAVVARGYVLAVEAAEGTDNMLRRCGELRQWGSRSSSRRQGVLVKRPKPRQEIRVDMPTIGPRTVELAADAGLAGVAILAGGVLLAERSEILRIADERHVFVVGVGDKG